MSVNTILNSKEFTGDGNDNSPYAFSFPVQEQGDIVIRGRTIATGAELTTLLLTTDYTVSIATDGATANIILVTTTESDAVIASGATMIIAREQVQKQTSTYTNFQGAPEEVIEGDFDDLQLQIQHLQAQIDRCIKLQVTEPLANLTTGTTLGTLIGSGSKPLIVNAAETGIDVGTLAEGVVIGPASATDNALARFDATTGELIQNSVIIVDDSGNMLGIGTLASSGDMVLNTTTGNIRLTVDTDNGGGSDQAEFYLRSGSETGFMDVSQNASRFRIATNSVGTAIVLAPDTNDTNLTLSGASGSEQAVFTGTVSGSNLSGTNTGDEPSATASAEGVVELATSAEVTTGTDTGRTMTPESLTQSSPTVQAFNVASGVIKPTGTYGTQDLGVSEDNPFNKLFVQGIDLYPFATPSTRHHEITSLVSGSDAGNEIKFRLMNGAQTLQDVLVLRGDESTSLAGVLNVTGDITASQDLTVDGFINVGTGVAATIASGVITASATNMVVDTESAASADNLDTINGGSDGDLLIIRQASSTRDITLTEVGNISLNQGASTRVLDNGDDRIMLMFFGATSEWVELSFANNA